MQHVACDRAIFRGYNWSASSYTGICYSKPKAECLQKMILGEMARAYSESYNTGNMEIDCAGYGYYCDQLPAQRAKEIAAWQALTTAMSLCARMQ